MRVICIDDKKPIDRPNPVFGETYTVIETKEFKGNKYGVDGLYYVLKELMVNYYHSCLFAPLSSIDETEFERNFNKELV